MKFRGVVCASVLCRLAECVVIWCLIITSTADGAESAKLLLQKAAQQIAHAQNLHRVYQLAQTLPSAHNLEESLQAAKEALKLRQDVLGPNHPELVPCLQLIGHIHEHQDRFDAAEADLRRALTILEQNYGPAYPAAADILSELGQLQESMGRYDRAEDLLVRGLHVAKASNGAHAASVANYLTLLGGIYREQGRFELAKQRLDEAIRISESSLGENGQVLVLALNGLAELYDEWGYGELVDQLLTRALRVSEKQVGPNAARVVPPLRHLGDFLLRQGDPERAEPLLRRAREITASIVGPDSPAVLSSLASWKMRQSRYAEAEALLSRALALEEAAGADRLPRVIALLSQLLRVALEQGETDRALSYGYRSLKIAETAYGKAHPETASALIDLGDVYRAKSNGAAALDFYQQARNNLELGVRTSHPMLASVLARIAKVHMAYGELAKANGLMVQAIDCTEQRILREGLLLSDSRLTYLMDSLRHQEDLIYTLLEQDPEGKDALRLSLATALLRKGRIFDEAAEASRVINRSICAQDGKDLATLRALRARIARLGLEGPSELGAQVHASRLRAIEEKAGQLEDALMRRTAQRRANRGLPEPADIVLQVAGRLRPREVLIEFILYSRQNIKLSRELSRKTESRYMALLLHAGGRMDYVDLGPAQAIDSAASRLLAALSSPRTEYREAARDAYHRLFFPLKDKLSGVRDLLISPDGPISLLPFGPLLDEKNHFLRDTYNITYLTSGRDLLRREVAIKKVRPDGVVIFADPAFQESPVLGAALASTLGTSKRERGMRIENIDQLPGTREEAEALRLLFPNARLFTGRQASEPALLALEAPDILHIATHGIFLAESQPPTAQETRGFDEDAVQMPPNPMLRSALVMAGAQQRHSAAKPIVPDSEGATVDDSDGLVTALEASAMNLWGTQLVVLSACESGRGDVKLGQGVYGLRRAIMVAGAETLVTSLWKINDSVTKDLMVRYYRYLLAGRGRTSAMHQAARDLARQHPHPYYWASFIVIGRSESMAL